MAGPPNAENVVASGPKGTVEYAVRANGTVEVREWLESQDAALQARFDLMFRQLADKGPLFPNKEQFKKIQGVESVWEFKRGDIRIFCFQHGRRWLLTSVYHKSGNKKEQTRAAKLSGKIANEHLESEQQRIGQEQAHDSEGEDYTDPGGSEDVAPGEDDLRDDEPDV